MAGDLIMTARSELANTLRSTHGPHGIRINRYKALLAASNVNISTAIKKPKVIAFVPVLKAIQWNISRQKVILAAHSNLMYIGQYCSK